MLQSRIRGALMGRKKIGVKWEIAKRYASVESGDSAATQEVAPTQGYAPLPTGIAADPAVHSSDPPQGQDTEEATKTSSANRPPRTTADESDPLVPPTTPTSSSSRIGHTEVGQPSEPNTQQRRKLSIESENMEAQKAQKAQKKAQERDNKEYFKNRKASPLSEVEFADTRKPVSQKTDSPTSYYGGEPDVIVWAPEQLDSAEDSLLRAVEIFTWNKMRGDPESPHGRVLRELRGENW